ncbi:MAG: BglG family transcription antiterminator [Oscillospiraceae bacterium]|nr:BglG family transcription antiterminator [Oscillospiraceae bacterium]
MTIRQISILNKLRTSKEPLRQKDLAGIFSVSLRTIQSDLKTIGFYLKLSGINGLENHYGEGLILKLTREENKKLDKLISGFSGQSEAFDVEVRREHLVKLLVVSGEFITIAEMAERIGVSRGTILNDLKAIRNELKDKDIQLISHPRHGSKLEGEEGAVREYLLKKYLANVNASCLSGIENYHRSSIVNRFFEIRDITDTEFVFHQVEQAVRQSKRMLTGNAFLNIISRLELAIERIRIGRIISFSPFYLESVYGTWEYKVIYEMTDRIGKKLGIAFALEEVGYLAFLLLGSNIVSVQRTSREENYAEMQVAVFNLIRSVEDELSVDFSGDASIYNDLVYHIRPAVFRIKNGIMQKNPLKEEIQKKYPDIFDSVKRNVRPLEAYIGVAFPDDEICYIAIHFAAVRERQIKNTIESPNVLIVCDSGIGTSNLLASRIMAIYDVNVVDTVAYYELERSLAKYDVEYIVSTLDLDYEGKTVIRANPLISGKDMEMLNRYFRRRRHIELDEVRFFEVLERHCIITNKEDMKKDLYREFSLIFKSTKKDTEGEKMLIDVMHKDMMELDFPAKDWEEAVRESGRLLMKGSCIDQEYIESMVNTVRAMGPYIVISEGIALPHSRSGEHAYKVGISLLRLKEPVVFGHPENDPVDLVFGLSSIDNKAHLSALRDFSKILSDPQNVEILRKAETTDDVYNFLISMETGARG